MKTIATLIVFVSLVVSYSSFAEAPDENAITQQEIAQTLKNMNDLMADARAAPKLDAKAYEQLDLQRASDLITHLEEGSDQD